MHERARGGGGWDVVRASVAVLAVVAVVVAAALLTFGSPASGASSRLTPASGSSQQWAFGGIASTSYSCTNSGCLGYNETKEPISLTLQYYIEWVVIFTQTNISATQTMIESQAALNASVTYSLSSCIVNGTGPCRPESGNIGFAGKETANGFTNITNGTVNMVAPSTGSAPALAVLNAASQEAFNFSGSYSLTGPFGPDNATESASASFDFGANEASSVTFGSPLGIVPLNPQPNDVWNSTAPFSATGSWTSGYSFTVSGSTSASESNWTSGTVSPSGELGVNGTDLGQYTLYDNYTNPPTHVTAQLISLDFGGGPFEAEDGWILIPFGIYDGVLYGLSGSGLAVEHGPSGVLTEARPLPSAISAPSGETAYYHEGSGFIGAGATESSSGVSGVSGLSVKLTAGPEPVSVAEQQYDAVTSSGSSSSGLPLLDIVLVVVVVLVVVALVVVLMARRSRARRSAAAVPPPAGDAAGVAPVGPTPPAMQPAPAVAPGPTAVPPPPPPPAPTTPICPRCGQPSTYVAQYNRYYCYADQQYL